MRRKLVLGVGLAGLLGGSVAGQPNIPAPFGGGKPVGAPSVPATLSVTPTGGYVAPVGGFQPVAAPAGMPPSNDALAATPVAPSPVVIPSALGANHPLATKAEHGAYFVCVRSYSRPARPTATDPGLPARELAEGLAGEIQRLPQAQGFGVYLFEYVSEEKKAEAAAAAAARQQRSAFVAALDKYQKSSQLNGMEFLAPDNRIRYKTFNYRDQIAVLVGGFRTEDEAVKAMAKVKAWPEPKDGKLMDIGAITQAGADGKPGLVRAYINPFPQAMVVRNPVTDAGPTARSTALDPFVVKLNEGRPYNLLAARGGGWTLGVKSFSAPVQIQSKNEDSSFMRKMGFGNGSNALNAGAEQAEALAKALRELKGPPPERRPQNLEAFVMHHRTGSIVTVGQFDGPTDPALLDARRKLMAMTFTTTKDESGANVMSTGENLFGKDILPIPIPKR